MKNLQKKEGSITFVIGISLVATLGGLLFGYDTAVISGGIGFLQKFFLLDGAMTGWAAGSAIAGCILGAVIAGGLSDKFGRKKVLIFAAVMFLVSAIGSAIPKTLTEFIIYRIIGGIGVGAASMTSPLYIAEVSPAKIRGRLVSLNQFAIIFGMLVVYFVNYYIGDYGANLNTRFADSIISDKITKNNDTEKKLLSGQIASQIENFYKPTEADTINHIAALLARDFNNKKNPGSLKKEAKRLNLPLNLKEPVTAKKFCSALAMKLSFYGIDFTAGEKSTIAAESAAGTLSSLILPGTSSINDYVAQFMIAAIEKKTGKTQMSQELKETVKTIAPATLDAGRKCWNVEKGWRWMFGSESLPALTLLILLFFVPESPRWLAKQEKTEEAKNILEKIGGAYHAEQELAEIKNAVEQESGSLTQLFKGKMLTALLIGVTLAVCQQATGINVFLYYAPKIFANMGFGTSAALYQTIIVGAVNLSFTIIAIWTVDKLGRKPLMLVGSLGMAVSMFIIGGAAYYNNTNTWVLIFILGYIACFALSLGPVVWVYLSEIFPTKIRGQAMSIATFALWIACFIISQTFPMMDQNKYLVANFHHSFPFFMYGAVGIFTVIFVFIFVPETKGKSLEEIEDMWVDDNPA